MTLILSGTDGLSDIDGSAATPAIRGTDANTGIFFGADIIGFAEGGAEAMRIDSSGNLLVGTTSSTFSGQATNGIGISRSGAALFALNNSSNTNQTWMHIIYDSGLGTAGTYSIGQVINGSTSGLAGGPYTPILNLAVPSSASNTPKVAIDSSGNLLVGTTANAVSGYSAGKSFIQSADYSNAGACLINSTSTTGLQYFLVFGRGGTQCGQITSGATNSTSYTTSSDYRLKKDVQPMTGALAKVQALKPCTYKWIEDDTTSEGFIAHELAETFPQAVVGEKDWLDDDGNPRYQGVDTSFLVATLTAAIQEQQALITALTSRITALETK